MGATLPSVQRLQVHRWVVIFLLVSRLIIGEFAHSSTHESEGMVDAHHAGMVAAVVSDEPLPCPDHMGPNTQPARNASGDAAPDTDGSKDCCEKGGCECPCLHLPAAAPPASFSSYRVTGELVATHVEGVVRHRSTALFRPPA